MRRRNVQQQDSRSFLRELTVLRFHKDELLEVHSQSQA